MAKLTALYDACVLYPAPLRDLLVRLAGTGLFRARWTNEIHEEWIRNLLLLDLDEETVCVTLRSQRLDLKRSPKSADEMLTTLELTGLKITVSRLRPLVKSL